MKQYLFLILFILSYSGFAQKNLKKANELFLNKSFVKAAELYENLEKTPEVLQNLGDSYYYTGDMVKAHINYESLYNKSNNISDKEVLFRYGHTLKALNNYNKADKIFGEYYGFKINTQMFIDNAKDNTIYQYEIQPLIKNTKSGDFGISFFKDKIVFSSARTESSPIYSWNDKPYLDLYMATVTADGKLDSITPFSKEINTNTHESSAIFTKDGKTMYFDRTNNKRIKIGDQEIATVKIYKATLENEIWTNVIELPFSSDHYSVQNPTLNHDESKLFFSSDMPGTLGSLDLFYVDINTDGTFGEPINLGENVNTKHREQFPFLDSKNTLFFASDGHEGFGGLDIFMSKFDEEKNSYKIPENAGEQINSGFDDFSYVVSKNDTIGYFSSNRNGIDNIYSFKRTYTGKKYSIEGIVKDKHTNELLPGTVVTLYDENQRMVGQLSVESKAYYQFITKPNTKYRIEAYKDLYIPYSEEIITDDEGRILRNIELLMESYDAAEEIVVKKDDGLTHIELENIYFDFDKWNIKKESKLVLNTLVELLKKYPNIELSIRSHTDSRASAMYNLTLSKKRAKSTYDYLVSQGIDKKRLTYKGYGENSPLINCGKNCTEDEHSINRRSEFIILK